jgi:hypothetical protein
MEREDRTGRKHRRVGWILFWGLTVVAGFLFGVYHGERKSSTALFGRGGFSGKVDALQCPTCPRCEPTRCPDPASARECPRCEGGAVGSGAGSSFGASDERDAGGAKTTEATGAKTENRGAGDDGNGGGGGDGDAGGCPRRAPCPKCGVGGTCPDPPRCGDGGVNARGGGGGGAGGCACDECPVCKRPGATGECPAHPPCRT